MQTYRHTESLFHVDKGSINVHIERFLTVIARKTFVIIQNERISD